MLTLTLNPAIDVTVTLEALRPGQVNPALRQERHAAGKGINVASCLADWGAAVTATGLLGADNESIFRALFAEKRIADRCTRIPGETRTNIKLLDRSSGETTDINLPGLAPDAAALDACIAEVEQARDELALDELEARLHRETRELEIQLAGKIDAEKNYADAAGLVRKLRFMEKLAEEIHSAYDEIDN